MLGEVTDTAFIKGKMGEKFTVLNCPIPCPLVLLRECFGDKTQCWAVKEADCYEHAADEGVEAVTLLCVHFMLRVTGLLEKQAVKH